MMPTATFDAATPIVPLVLTDEVAIEDDPTVSPFLVLFEEALRAQLGPFDPQRLQQWFRDHAPEVDPLWVEGRTVADTVNDRGRQHYPGPRDVLFRRDDGRLERYRPQVHGWWSAAGRRTDAAFGKSWAARRVPQASWRVVRGTSAV